MSWRTTGCPRCGASPQYIVTNPDGSVVCSKCGYVVEEQYIDVGPEWRSFTAEDKIKRSRIGAPLTERVHDKGVTTFIYPSRKDLRSYKLAALQASLRSHGSRKLIELLREVNSVTARLGLPQRVAEMAAKIMRLLYEQGVLKRSNLDAYLAAALVAAARITGYTLTMREVSKHLGVSELQVWSAYRSIVTKLKLRARPPRPQDFVSKIASMLNLPGYVETLASKLIAELAKEGLTQGKPPQAMAAAAVYLASIIMNQKRNQVEIAKTIGVTDATIRNRYRDIVDNFYIEVRL